jgi:hypothetical protein
MRLTAIEPADPPRQELWRYRCSCGSVVIKPRRTVRAGLIKSCGCLNAEMRLARNLKHGRASRAHHDPLYWIWQAMLRRCDNPRNPDFKYYGARGVEVCASWRHDVEAFIRDMGPRPTARHSLDRIDTDGDYSPQNCRWATWHQQRMNQRRMKLARRETR